ncbi:hypothetical protein F53441_11957 [Fusarium austroafricanum]|uniref:Uncharacterized protein n=1 Tax=Fusarium austroafricanum TaxID=2364996 RepID=A0A8H4JZ42_9HYPO|nr:hypothetical protein F53441_11957 [Fusarium austroafricanum]
MRLLYGARNQNGLSGSSLVMRFSAAWSPTFGCQKRSSFTQMSGLHMNGIITGLHGSSSMGSSFACLQKLGTTPSSAEAGIKPRIEDSIKNVQSLASEVLSTVPQSFGDIDHLGRCHSESKPARWQAIGAYLLLWPIKIIKTSDSSTTEAQKVDAQMVFDRIRECTGMKSSLGALSNL